MHIVGKTNAVVFGTIHTISIYIALVLVSLLVHLVNSSSSFSGDIKQKAVAKQNWLLGKQIWSMGSFLFFKEDCPKLKLTVLIV